MKISKKETSLKHKHGVDIFVYELNRPEIGLVYVESNDGHFQEFYDTKSTFVYYVISGHGTFYLDGQPETVETGDVVVAPPMTKIYYLGSMKLILVTTPAWQAENEVHVRFIEKKDVLNE